MPGDANVCRFTDGREPHSWLQSARFSCRSCGFLIVHYGASPNTRSVTQLHQATDGSSCGGKLVRELLCRYCGVFKRILAK